MPRKKKRSAISKVSSRVASRKRKRSNPDDSDSSDGSLIADIAEQVVPGVLSYTAVRTIGRIAYKLAAKKNPKLARHAGAVVPALAAAGLWYTTGRMESTERYHPSISVGCGIAAVQSLAQAYVPQFTWVLNDYHLDDVLPQAAKAAKAANGGPQPTSGVTTDHRPSPRQLDPDDIPELEAYEGFGAATDDDALDALENDLYA